jgi:hypothetical protein
MVGRFALFRTLYARSVRGRVALVFFLFLFVGSKLTLELVSNDVDEGERIRAGQTGNECVLLVRSDDDLSFELFRLVVEDDLDFMDAIVESRQLPRLFLDVVSDVIGQINMATGYCNLQRTLLLTLSFVVRKPPPACPSLARLAPSFNSLYRW